MRSISILRQRLSGFLADQRGGVFAYVAVAAPAFFGIAGLSVDVGLWHAYKRGSQTISDSAATAAALELRRGGDSSEAAKFDALNNGIHPNLTATAQGYQAPNGDTIVINNPPSSGPYSTNNFAVEVIVQQPVPTLLASLLFEDQANVTSRSVALAETNDTCIWALNENQIDAVKINGTAVLDLDCGVFVNSSHPTEALLVDGGGELYATQTKVVGDYSGGGVMDPTPDTGAAPVTDPLAWMPDPSSNRVCDFNGNDARAQNGDNITLVPGVYCGNIKTLGNGRINLDPGLYILASGANLTISSQGTVTGNGVTIYLTETAGTITINGGATATLTAPLDDLDDGIPGVLFYEDRDAGAATHKFNGGSDMVMDGIFYFPNQALQYNGDSTTNTHSVMFIVDTVKFNGSTDIQSFGGSVDVNSLLVQATLVE